MTMVTHTSDSRKLVEDKMLQSQEEVGKYLMEKEAVYETPRSKLRYIHNSTFVLHMIFQECCILSDCFINTPAKHE